MPPDADAIRKPARSTKSELAKNAVASAQPLASTQYFTCGSWTRRTSHCATPRKVPAMSPTATRLAARVTALRCAIFGRFPVVRIPTCSTATTPAARPMPVPMIVATIHHNGFRSRLRRPIACELPRTPPTMHVTAAVVTIALAICPNGIPSSSPAMIPPARPTVVRNIHSTVLTKLMFFISIMLPVCASELPNENKMSDGGRGRASLGVKLWKSSHSGAYSGPSFVPSHG